jgi:transposase
MDRQTGEGYGTQTEAASGNRQAGHTQHVDPPGIAVAVMTHPITKSSTALALGFPSYRGDIALRRPAMAESRRRFDQDFKEGAVRIVRETGKPVAQVARDLGVNEGTLGNWVNLDRRRRGEGNGALGEDERAELARLRKENAELAMERDVLKRSVALWVKDAMGR